MFRPSPRTFALLTLAAALQACTVTVPGVGTLAHVATGATATTPTTTGTVATGTSKSTDKGQAGDVIGQAPSAPASGGMAADVGQLNANGAAIVSQAPRPRPQPGNTTTPTAAPSQAALRAGAIDDNAQFDDYLSYLGEHATDAPRRYDVSERHVITVRDASGQPAANVKVTVSAGDNVVFTGTTYANGQLLFFPKANPLSDVGSRFFLTAGDDTTHAVGFSRTSTTPWDLTVGGGTQVATPIAVPMLQQARMQNYIPVQRGPRLDLQIVIDTTGSMGGEIAQLQATLNTIASRISALPQAPSVRFGLVAFKDQQGSEYLTHKQDFTGSLPTFGAFLNGLTASGGGDLPEDDETALSEALTQSWDPTATARLSFLITDAPTHTDYPQATPYTASIAKAQAMGVKFFTVGASGLPADGEFFLRSLAEATMGKYMFITRGGDEYSGGGEVSATVDHFSEGQLDELMVNAVKDELASLGSKQVQLDPVAAAQ